MAIHISLAYYLESAIELLSIVENSTRLMLYTGIIGSRQRPPVWVHCGVCEGIN